MVDAEKKPRIANSFEECLRRVQDGEVPGRTGDNKASGRSGEDDDAEDTNLAKDSQASGCSGEDDDARRKGDEGDDAGRKGDDAGAKDDDNPRCKGNDAGDKNNNGGAKASKHMLGVININGQMVNVNVTRYS